MTETFYGKLKNHRAGNQIPHDVYKEINHFVDSKHPSSRSESYKIFRATMNTFSSIALRSNMIASVVDFGREALDFQDFKRAMMMYVTDDFSNRSNNFYGSAYSEVDWGLLAYIFEQAYAFDYVLGQRDLHYVFIILPETKYNPSQVIVRAMTNKAEVDAYRRHYQEEYQGDGAFIEAGVLPLTLTLRKDLDASMRPLVEYLKAINPIENERGNYTGNWHMNVYMKLGCAQFRNEYARWRYYNEND